MKLWVNGSSCSGIYLNHMQSTDQDRRPHPFKPTQPPPTHVQRTAAHPDSRTPHVPSLPHEHVRNLHKRRLRIRTCLDLLLRGIFLNMYSDQSYASERTGPLRGEEREVVWLAQKYKCPQILSNIELSLYRVFNRDVGNQPKVGEP
jgi:hypothetical protein